MKRTCSFGLLTALSLIATSGELLGQSSEPRGPERTLPDRVFESFDANGDGVLDGQERRRARAEFSRRVGSAGMENGFLLRQFDSNRDGNLDDRERQAMRRQLARRAAANQSQAPRPGRRNVRPLLPPAAPPHRPARVDLSQLLQMFDSDGDGRLRGAERSAAMAAYNRAGRE